MSDGQIQGLIVRLKIPKDMDISIQDRSITFTFSGWEDLEPWNKDEGILGDAPGEPGSVVSPEVSELQGQHTAPY